MRDLKILTALVYVCAAGVVLSFAGGIYTGIRTHQEESKPHPSVFPTPAMGQPLGGGAVPAPVAPGALPTPAH
jgi:hypothetical protein